ncbi:hypothetical protein [Gallaecimonas sp. GXIMD4217]|uniref:LpxL/LpxP family acyltransferase n=1 Tax=Gallaecimonas sp. GXIMD4217 TaxID=3131927 RepID=UPI00311ADBA9
MLHPRHWGIWLLIALLWCFALVPVRPRDRLARALGRWLAGSRLLKKRRRILLTNLKACFPEMTRDEAEQLFVGNVQAFCQTVLSLGELSWRSFEHIQSRVEIRGHENLEAVLANRGPLIFLTPHTFALDWAAKKLILNGVPLCNIFKPTGNDVYDYMMYRQRIRGGGSQFERGSGMCAMVKSIRGGQPCFYVADEDHGLENSVFAPFFATEKCTLPTLGRLSRAAKAKVLPVICGYDAEQARFVLHVLPALEQVPQEELASATAMNQAYEELIRLCLRDYMWSLRLLRNRDGSRPYGAEPEFDR